MVGLVGFGMYGTVTMVVRARAVGGGDGTDRR